MGSTCNGKTTGATFICKQSFVTVQTAIPSRSIGSLLTAPLKPQSVLLSLLPVCPSSTGHCPAQTTVLVAAELPSLTEQHTFFNLKGFPSIPFQSGIFTYSDTN